MRLLNTTTYQLEEFLADIPKYAILSHTWGKGEVTFRDIQDLHEAKEKAELETEGAKKQAELSKVEKIQNKAGWSKIEKSCEYVRKYKFKWIWIDTCCIDKSSSAELSEALNSMLKYYTEAHVCVAYLSDVLIEKNVTDLEELKSSRWFTRGWTLQELIAPRYMVFLDKDWDKIGTRYSIRHVVSEVTSIPVKVFEASDTFDGYSIAQKMSWAASRKTTREEDMAYCLMGLFGVNMPPIYGEGGAKAFMRLQQEIIRYSDDRSIFAWVSQDDRDRGMLASSPSEFASSGKVGVSGSDGFDDDSSFSFGNNGLRIHLPLTRLYHKGEGIFHASLHCQDPDGVIGIYLQKKEHRYTRWRPHLSLSHTYEPWGRLQEVVVKESAVPRQQVNYDNIPVEFKLDSNVSLLNEDVNEDDNPFLLSRDSNEAFKLRTKKGNTFNIVLGTRSGGVIPGLWMRLVIDGFPFGFEGDSLHDSFLLPIDDETAVVSCSAHTTGDYSDQRIVEINYIPLSTAKFQLYHQIYEFRCTSHALTSTTLNFMIAITGLSGFSEKVSVFPPDSFPWMWGGNGYVSIPYLCGQDTHCVFQWPYRYTPPGTRWCDGKRYVFIALGPPTAEEHHMPWVDAVVSTDELPISDVWKSYLSSGSRYECRNVGTATTALDIDEGLPLNVTVEKILGSAWYYVVLRRTQA